MLCGSHTLRGNHTAVNQDTTHAAQVSPKLAVAATFDGHGALGEVAAASAKEALVAALESDNASAWTAEPEECMKRLVHVLNEAVLAEHAAEALPATYVHKVGEQSSTFTLNVADNSFAVSGPGPQRASAPVDFGCTCAIAVLVGEAKLVVGNLGDSPIFLCSASEVDELHVSRLCMRHAADEAGEQERIGASACASSVKVSDGYLQALAGPLRGHALQPTRGLGHPVWSEYGVSSEPHVAVVDVSSAPDREGFAGFAVAVLSDGVSDVLSQRTILELVAEAGSAPAAARTLVAEAAAMSNVTTGGKDRDDASAAVLWWG